MGNVLGKIEGLLVWRRLKNPVVQVKDSAWSYEFHIIFWMVHLCILAETPDFYWLWVEVGKDVGQFCPEWYLSAKIPVFVSFENACFYTAYPYQWGPASNPICSMGLTFKSPSCKKDGWVSSQLLFFFHTKMANQRLQLVYCSVPFFLASPLEGKEG